MKMVQIGRITDAGKAAYRNLIESTASVADTTERVRGARAILSNPEFCSTVPGAGMIDLDARFETAHDFARHVYPAIMKAGYATLLEPGVNTFLYLAFIDQLIKKNARVLNAYFLDDRRTADGSISRQRNMRNTIYVHLMFYHFHHKDERVCKYLLAGHPSVLANHEERIAQRPTILSSAGAIELVLAMFYNPKTGHLHRTPPMGRDARAKPKDPNSALKELSVIVFAQYARNYDLSRMTARQMFDLVPDTKGLKPYKQHALRWFEQADAQLAEDPSKLSAIVAAEPPTEHLAPNVASAEPDGMLEHGAAGEDDETASEIRSQSLDQFAELIEGNLNASLTKETTRVYRMNNGETIRLFVSKPHRTTHEPFIHVSPQHFDNDWLAVIASGRNYGWIIPTRHVRPFLERLPFSSRRDRQVWWNVIFDTRSGVDCVRLTTKETLSVGDFRRTFGETVGA